MNSLRNRILLFFTGFALVAVGAVVFTGRSTQVVGTAAESVVNKHLPLVYAFGQMEASLLRQDSLARRYLDDQDAALLEEIEKERIKYARFFLEAESFASVNAERDKLKEIDDLYVDYENAIRQALLNRNKSASLRRAHLNAAQDILLRIQGLIMQIQDLRQGMTIVRQQQIINTIERQKRFTVYFLMVIAVLFLGLSFYLFYALVRPLSFLVDGIRNFTRGRLDIQIPAIGKDELGELQDAFNEMSREIAVERKRLKSESQSDPLTGLFNMRYFRLQLVEEFSRCQRYAHPLTLLMIDVDFFKEYNDKNGHPAGDIVLKEVSRIMIRNVRGTDIVARYGGEEFVILLPETDQEAAFKVAEKIRAAVEDHHFPFQGEDEPTRLTVSIGVASYPHPAVTSDQDLVEASDKALYEAKSKGRNKVVVYSPERKTASA